MLSIYYTINSAKMKALTFLSLHDQISSIANVKDFVIF
jgi:hypothetical protein